MPSAKSDNNTAVIEQIAVGNRNNVTRGNKFPLFQSFSQEPSQVKVSNTIRILSAYERGHRYDIFRIVVLDSLQIAKLMFLFVDEDDICMLILIWRKYTNFIFYKRQKYEKL